MKYIVCIWMSLYGFSVTGQSDETKIPVRQVYLQLDNDAYSFTGYDRYYTNGLFLKYSQQIRTGGRIWIGISHQIYTPDTITRGRPVRFDRPYAGVVYLEAGYQFFKEDYLVDFQLIKGKIGPSARAAEFQKWYHNLFGFPEPRGWEFQIKDHQLTNASGRIVVSVFKTNRFDWLVAGRAAYGNLEKSLAFSPSIRFGKFHALGRSEISGSRTGVKSEKELFVWAGMNFARIYRNASLQGGELIPENDYFAMMPEKRVNEYFAEIVWAPSGFAMRYRIFYRTKETQAAVGQLIGSLSLSYLF